MSTSGGTIVNAFLYALVLALAVQVGLILLAGRPPGIAPAAVGLWLLVAVPSLLQLRFPRILTALRRDPDLIRHHGQVWRVLTSVLAQDGGPGGTVFNLAILAIVALVAVPVWGPARALLVFGTAQLVFNTLATFLVDNAGAGNSGATLGLASSVVGLGLPARPVAGVWLRAIGLAGCGAVLLWLDDGHGVAVLAGILIGLVVALVSPPRSDGSRRSSATATGPEPGPDVADSARDVPG